MSKKYDLDRLRRVPILMVAERLGVMLVKTGADTWQAKGEKKNEVTSLTLFGKTNNFVRFSGEMHGGCSKGSVIDFVMHIKDLENFDYACGYLESFL